MSTVRLSAKMDRTDGSTPWGFRMAGGKDFGSPLVIQKVNPGSLAAKCGLNEGDTIIRIGRIQADGLRHKEAQNAIMDSGNSLELALERHGSVAAPSFDSYAPAPSPASFSVPRPYGDGISSVSSQLGSINLGSAPQGTDGAHDLSMTSSLHEHNYLHASLNNSSNSSPTTLPPDNTPPALPGNPPPPSCSAIYNDQGDGDHPRYQGFQDPGSQSRTFKNLQNLIETGQDVQTLRSNSPVGGKPAVGSKPAFLTKPAVKASNFDAPESKDFVETGVGLDEIVDLSVERKTIVIPSKQQSPDEIVDVPTERKTLVIPSANRTNAVSRSVGIGSNPVETTTDVGSKVYYPSETFKLVQEQEAGVPQNISPMTGAEIKSTQSRTLMMLDRILDKNDTVEVTVERKTVVIPANKSSAHSRAPPPAQSAASPRPGQWQPQVPTGPRKMKVARAGEAKSLPPISGGMRIPVCSGCGTAIRGPFVSALDKTWCPDHFICANPHCHTPLINIGFVEEEGQLYCEKDYEQYFAPRCGKCGRAIIGEVVNAMKNTFHMGCFLCCQCNQPIGTGSFHNEDGKIYCPKDWAAMFQTKCYGCQFPIEPGDRWVEALNQNWHSECFNCSTCQVSLEGQSFVAKNGKPYCKKHAGTGRF